MKQLKTLLFLLLFSISLGHPRQAWSVEDWMATGLSGLKTQHIEKAIEAFSRAIASNPEHVAAYNNRGIAWCNKGDYDRAIADYNRALEIDPRCAEVYNNRGGAWFYKGNYAQAINDYDRALGIDPNFSNAYSNRGAAWFCKGNIELAISDYNRALEINPNSAATNKQLAWILSVSSGNIKKSDPKKLEEEDKAFSVQVGAFQSRENAQKLTELLKAKGYAARLQPFEGWSKKVLYTVRMGEYGTRREAEKKAAAFSSQEQLPSTVRPAGEL